MYTVRRTENTFVRVLSADYLKRVCDLHPLKCAAYSWNPPKSLTASIERRVLLYDVTLREGEQSGYVQAFPRDFKIKYARVCATVHVDAIEAGFPAASFDEVETIKEIVKLELPVDVVALARAKRSDVDIAVATGVKKVAIFAPCSDILMYHQLGVSRLELLKMVQESISHARNLGVRVRFGAKDATRAEIGFLLDVVRTAEEAGAEDITLADTLGLLTPPSIAFMTEFVSQACGVLLGVHCHNDFGMATANAISAASAGASWVHVSSLGLGERAGIVPVEEIVPLLLSNDEVKLSIFPRKVISMIELCESFLGHHPIKAKLQKRSLIKCAEKLEKNPKVLYDERKKP